MAKVYEVWSRNHPAAEWHLCGRVEQDKDLIGQPNPLCNLVSEMSAFHGERSYCEVRDVLAGGGYVVVMRMWRHPDG